MRSIQIEGCLEQMLKTRDKSQPQTTLTSAPIDIWKW